MKNIKIIYNPNKLYKLSANKVIKELYNNYKDWNNIKDIIKNKFNIADDIKELLINQINLYNDLLKKDI